MSGLPEHLQDILTELLSFIDMTDEEAVSELDDFCDTLSAAARAVPPGMSDLARLLHLCDRRLRMVAAGGINADDSAEVLAAVRQSLAAAELYLADHPEKERLIREAGHLLDQMARKSREDADEDVSLDDAAILLVQIEPNDFDDLRRLDRILSDIIRDAACPPACLKLVGSARDRIGAVLAEKQASVDFTIPEEAIVAIGQKIEAAMAAAEGNIQAGAEGPESGEAVEPDDYLPDDMDVDLISAFIAESNDLITNAEESLLALESDTEDLEAVSTVFRAFHNIKGTSAFFELSLMTELAHLAESVLSRVRDGEIRYAGDYPDLALRSVDMLKDLFRGLESSLSGSPFGKPKGYDELVAILADPEAAGILDTVDEPLSVQPVTEEPAAPVTGEASPDGPREPEPVEMDHPSETPPKETAEGSSPQKPAAARQVVESSIRVPIDRLDRFIDMVGELVVSHSMVAQDEVVVGSRHHELQKKVAHTTKIVRELQNMSMSMRMIPLKTTFRKMARLIRDLSRKVGKDVIFVTEGEDTEIDRNMVDIINDPLVHMVRNALDHGIEMPEVRERKGKPRHGTVHLSAYHSAGNVVVEVRDDGRGLDRETILDKARERELIGDGDHLSEREVYNLIFEPGFSTAKIVSDVSGRGVGMDVVKRNIEAIRGHVEIQAEPDEGCIFKMSLPLTLAIIDGMVVRVGNEKYVIPTISIVRSVQPRREDLSTVLHKGDMLRLQGRLIPLFHLAELFQMEGAVRELTDAIAVIVENDGNQAGLLVDELIGSQQIVIKTLGETLGSIPGISGSAIMPNGRVGLIIDVGGLVRLAHR